MIPEEPAMDRNVIEIRIVIEKTCSWCSGNGDEPNRRSHSMSSVSRYRFHKVQTDN